MFRGENRRSWTLAGPIRQPWQRQLFWRRRDRTVCPAACHGTSSRLIRSHCLSSLRQAALKVRHCAPFAETPCRCDETTSIPSQWCTNLFAGPRSWLSAQEVGCSDRHDGLANDYNDRWPGPSELFREPATPMVLCQPSSLQAGFDFDREVK